MLETGRQRAEAEGLDLTWRELDVEHLTCDDGEHDVVISCVGVMFAPFHQPVADQLARVTRSAGTIALANWTPAGFVGQLFAVMKTYAAPPPAGASPGPLWGNEDHVRELFGDRVSELRATKELLRVDRFSSGAEFRDFFKATYGPTIAAYRNVADDPERIASLDREIAEVADRFGASTGVMEWEYLLVVATRV
ncbi:MAG: class I SAM-dependent methyltransferase [Actinomycetota bacterium]|nr:class I SAM-dependent methyltransferase [Actinomycetota bacterium]